VEQIRPNRPTSAGSDGEGPIEGANDLKAVRRHLDYIGRYGNLELESDDGDRLPGRTGKALLDDWDLDIDEVRRQSHLAATKGGTNRPRLLTSSCFSMPAGTSPEKVLGAVRNFAREEFLGSAPICVHPAYR